MKSVSKDLSNQYHGYNSKLKHAKYCTVLDNTHESVTGVRRFCTAVLFLHNYDI